MVSITITTGQKQWYVVREYRPPNDKPMVHRLEQALAHVPAGVETLLVGDLNARLPQPPYQRKEYLTIVIANFLLVYQTL